MKTHPSPLSGVYILEPRIFADAHNSFYQSFDREALRTSVGADFVPATMSRAVSTQKSIIRGLHYQHIAPQARLVSVAEGSIWSVALDVRPASPQFGRWFGTEISSTNRHQLFVPGGHAHGYQTLTDHSDVQVLFDAAFLPDDSRGVLWSDDELAITWPLSDPLLSARDRAYPCLREIPPTELPLFIAGRGPNARSDGFLSYASQDGAFAGELYRSLQSRCFDMWFASQSLDIGERFRQTIEDKIGDSTFFLVVLSRHSIESEWVEFEIEIALEKERTNKTTLVLPITLDDSVSSSKVAPD